jgi:hypothetical protein
MAPKRYYNNPCGQRGSFGEGSDAWSGAVQIYAG